MSDKDTEIVIKPGMGALHYWRDIWRYRELFFFLAWRDILVRYKQTAIGIAWSVLRPLLTMIVFTVVFGTLAKLPSNGVPYPIMVFAAMLPWQFFANSLTESSNSLIGNANLLTKVYFPRLIVPAGSVIVGLVDFFISLVILFAIMAWYQLYAGYQNAAAPLLPWVGFSGVIRRRTCGFRRSMSNIGIFVMWCLFWSSSGCTSLRLAFPAAIVPEKWRIFYFLNPMVGVIDGFRWAILGDAFPVYWPGMILSAALTLLMFIGGLLYFRKMERSFADVI